MLVTDFNPLHIWWFNELYIRLSANDYDTKDLDNKFTHLTNNSIAKKSHNPNIQGYDNMYTQEQLKSYLLVMTRP